MTVKGIALALALTLASPLASAQFGSKSQFSRLPGVGFMTVAVDNDHLVIILETGAKNILGFDHPPTTRLQERRVDEILETLRDEEQVLDIPMSALCRKIDSEVPDPFDNGSNGHYEFYLSYEFKCRQPDAINQLTFQLFQLLPRLKMIKVQWMSTSNMGMDTLNRSRRILSMR